MPTFLLRSALPAALGCAFGLHSAHADISIWVDASGAANYSNLDPPEGARVVYVVHDDGPEVAATRAAAAATREAAARQAEVQALSERVRQLEQEIDFARRQVPPAVQYAPAAPSPAVQLVVSAPAPTPGTGYDRWSMDYWPWWGSTIYYPAGIFVPRSLGFHHFGRFHEGHHHFAGRSSMHASGGFHRR